MLQRQVTLDDLNVTMSNGGRLEQRGCAFVYGSLQIRSTMNQVRNQVRGHSGSWSANRIGVSRPAIPAVTRSTKMPTPVQALPHNGPWHTVLADHPVLESAQRHAERLGTSLGTHEAAVQQAGEAGGVEHPWARLWATMPARGWLAGLILDFA